MPNPVPMGLRRALWLVAVVATATPAASEDWSFALSAFVFDPPKDSPYISPIFYADRGGLHLEARYNYEDLETGSLFVGRSFDFGENVSFTAVPMLGIVAGSTNGVAPGAEIEIAWRRLALYAESEYVLDLEDSDASFLYTWSEATLAPVDWLRFGLVVQRTRTYDTGLDLQRGLLIELSHAKLSFAFHWFNPDRTEDQVFAYAAGYEF